MKRSTFAFLAAIVSISSAVALGTVLFRTPNPEPQIVSGKALIGGPFTLTDHTGKRVTEKDFLGKLSLVYFGYTYCPDVCPAELQVMAAAIDELGAKKKMVTPIFITIDPERDTVEQMNSYVSNFHEQLIGLTGTPQEIKAVTGAYKIYYKKVSDDPSSTDYVMDHSSIVYLMSPKGEYLTHFSYGAGVDKMAKGIAKYF
ncbi:MAG: SCO family protein [Alphaproteobacteria bacterium]